MDQSTQSQIARALRPLTDPTVVVTLRDVYGVTKAYPANEAAEIFARIAGTKTLSSTVLSAIGLLGFKITTKGATLADIGQGAGRQS